MQRSSFTSFAALLALVISLANAFNQTGYTQGGPQTVGSAFTYQGRLDNNGAPVNGAYDVEFALFERGTAGNLLSITVAIHRRTKRSQFYSDRFFGDTFLAKRRMSGSNSALLSRRKPRLPAIYSEVNPYRYRDIQ